MNFARSLWCETARPDQDVQPLSRSNEQHPRTAAAARPRRNGSCRLAAYGWTDLDTTCDFYLDYEIDRSELWRQKKPYRYRFPDSVRDELLARLLDRNQARFREEQLAGLHSKESKSAAPCPPPLQRPPRQSVPAAPKPPRARQVPAKQSHSPRHPGPVPIRPPDGAKGRAVTLASAS